MSWYAVFNNPIQSADQAVQREGIAALLQQLSAISPRIARSSAPDAVQLVLDLGQPSTRQVVALANQLHALLHSSPLAFTLGLACNPVVAQLAARITPPGSSAIIPPGREATFLAPLPITALPISPTICDRLQRVGITTIGALASLSRRALQEQFGTLGVRLHDLAHGQASMPFVPLMEVAAVRVRRYFASPIANRLALDLVIARMTPLLAARLAQQGWSTQQVTLVLELNDAPDVQASQALAYPTSDAALLISTMRTLLAAQLPTAGVVAVQMLASELTQPQTQQLTLFAEPVTAHTQLTTLVPGLAPRLRGQLFQAQLVASQARCPEQQVALHPLEGA